MYSECLVLWLTDSNSSKLRVISFSHKIINARKEKSREKVEEGLG